MQLEIAVSNLKAAIAAGNAGAHRIELCDNLREGGTTPSYGYLKQAREQVMVPVYPIVRPRGGNFVYNEEELQAMHDDILTIKKIGHEGMVIGLLTANGDVDVANTLYLVNAAARKLDITFHRAFDRARDPFQALEDIIECGCSRILTSGQTPLAINGTQLIKRLVEQAGDRITIMVGSGVRAANLQQLINETGAKEYHSSAKRTITKEEAEYYSHPNFPENDGLYDMVDVEEIGSMMKIINDNQGK